MTDELRAQQADAFVDHARKTGVVIVWRSAFAMWAASKVFGYDDFLAIERLIEQRLEPARTEETPERRVIPRGIEAK